jgi:hypothetical protein
VGEPSPAAWEKLKQDLRAAYDGVLAFFDRQRDQPIGEWIPIHAAGLAAMIGHNAYHLGAIRQLMLEVRG